MQHHRDRLRPTGSPFRLRRFQFFRLIVVFALTSLVGQALWLGGGWAQPLEANLVLPVLEAHPLPRSLEQWHDSQNQGDYLSAIQPTEFGYLVWSEFPINVYVEPAITDSDNFSTGITQTQAETWVDAVTQAVQDWVPYLPLQLVDGAETADIAIWRTNPALRTIGDRTVRARSAETRYEIYRRQAIDGTADLKQRFTILIRPSQTPDYLRAAARHELGHALGIWGHSPVATDALYFSQVRNPPPISIRDVNTLKRVYEQPTRLGWRFETESGG